MRHSGHPVYHLIHASDYNDIMIPDDRQKILKMLKIVILCIHFTFSKEILTTISFIVLYCATIFNDVSYMHDLGGLFLPLQMSPVFIYPLSLIYRWSPVVNN